MATQRASIKRPAPRLRPARQRRSNDLLGSLKIWQKLVLIALAFTLPVLLLSVLVLRSQNAAISKSRTEFIGIKQLEPVSSVPNDLTALTGYAILTLSRPNDPSLAQKIEEKIDNIDGSMTTLAAYKQQYGDAFGAADETQAIIKVWQEYRENLRTGTMTLEQIADATDNFIELQLVPFARAITDGHGILQDAELGSYYLSDVIANIMPELADELNDLQVRVTRAGTESTLARRIEIAGDTEVSSVLANEATQALTSAAQANFAGAAQLQNAAEEAQKVLAEVNTQVENEVVLTSEPSLASTEIIGQINRIADLYGGLEDSTIALLERSAEARLTELNRQQLLTFVISAFVLALTYLLVAAVARRISGPISQLFSASNRLSNGDLSARADVFSTDELGALAKTFNASVEQLQLKAQTDAKVLEGNRELQANIGNFLDVAMDIADGDFTKRGVVSEDALGNVIDAINLMVEEIGGVLQDVRQAALSVDQGAGEMLGSSGAIAQSADLTAGEAQRVRAQVENVILSIKDMAAQADNASDAATRALRASRQGQEAVSSTLSGMAGIREETRATAERVQQLGERSAEISEIVETISHIASQTNLLALGAALEAAGAGEAGDRFAVVADEVRKLADESAEAASRIFTLISTVQTEVREVGEQVARNSREVESGYTLAGEAGERLREISESVQQSARLAESISRATDAQTSSVEEVGSSVQSMSELTENARGRVLEGQQAAATLQNVASRLSEALVRFRLA